MPITANFPCQPLLDRLGLVLEFVLGLEFTFHLNFTPNILFLQIRFSLLLLQVMYLYIIRI